MKKKIAFILVIIVAILVVVAVCLNRCGSGQATTEEVARDASTQVELQGEEKEVVLSESGENGLADKKDEAFGDGQEEPEADTVTVQEQTAPGSEEAAPTAAKSTQESFPEPVQALPEYEEPEEPASEAAQTAAPTPTRTPASTAPEPEASREQTTESAPQSTPEPHTSCSWDGGSVTQAATCGSEGVKTYSCTVCGNTRTESIPRTSHSYVTETTEATCTTAGTTKTYCSICGDVQSQGAGAAALGHDFERYYWPSAPTCTCWGTYILNCTRCGENSGDWVSEPPIPHTPVTTEICHGNCSVETITVTTCTVCGLELSRDAHYEDDHDWVTGLSDPEWDEESESFVQREGTYCSRCSAKP